MGSEDSENKRLEPPTWAMAALAFSVGALILLLAIRGKSERSCQEGIRLRLTWPAGVVPNDVSRICAGENATSSINFAVYAKTGVPTYSDIVLLPDCSISYTVDGVKTNFGPIPPAE